MRRLLTKIVALLCISLSQNVFSGDMQNGFVAFDNGDDATAIRELEPFAKQGDILAQFVIGAIYFDGSKNVPKNYEKAKYWLQLCADQGDSACQFYLGNIYLEGETEVDVKKAVELFIASANQGDPDAQFSLAEIYLNGMAPVKKDTAKAAGWLEKSAEQNNSSAQLTLGVLYQFGEGVKQDYGKALYWFKKAADKGDPVGQVFVGDMYKKGLGVEKDVKLAAMWYRRAADQGEDSAQVYLAASYFRGYGVPVDYVLAYMWANIAAAQGNTDAKDLRATFTPFMTAQQLEEAQRLSRNWKPTPENQEKSDGLSQDIRKKLSTTGTGFFVTKAGHLLTNAHVAKDCADLLVASQFVTERKATLVSLDELNDFALLKTSANADYASFRGGAPAKLGEPVIVFGFPLAGALASSGNLVTGTLSALAGLNNDPRHYQITAPVQPGNSGGPLLDQSGQVIGVVVSKLNAVRIAEATGDIPQNVNFAIKGYAATAFLEANGIEPIYSSSKGLLDPTAAAETAQSFTVRVECLK